MVEDSEIEAAFRFFDPEGKGSINIQDLKKRLQPFYKDMPLAEYKFLLGEARSMTLKDLKDLLADNDVAGFDPVAEAFKVYDPSGTGFVQPSVLRDIFKKLGFDDLNDDDMRVLVSSGGGRCQGARIGFLACPRWAACHAAVAATACAPPCHHARSSTRRTVTATGASLWKTFARCSTQQGQEPAFESDLQPSAPRINCSRQARLSAFAVFHRLFSSRQLGSFRAPATQRCSWQLPRVLCFERLRPLLAQTLLSLNPQARQRG